MTGGSLTLTLLIGFSVVGRICYGRRSGLPSTAKKQRLYLALKRLYADLTACLVGDPPISKRKKLQVAAMRRLRYWLEKKFESIEAKRFIKKVRNGF